MPKPRQRQRIVFCDCYDCLDRPEPTTVTQSALEASTAVARQEPPPKALILYASGFLQSSGGSINVDECILPHLDKVTKEGNLGMLAVRSSTAQEGTAGMSSGVSELTQLLGVHEDGARMSQLDATQLSTAKMTSLADRFKGMQSSFASTSPVACQLAQALGMSLAQQVQLSVVPGSSSGAAEDGAPPGASLGLPDAASYASALVAELEPDEGSSGTDLVMVHIDLKDLVHNLPAQRQPAPSDPSTSAANPGTNNTDTDPQATTAPEAEALYDTSLEGLEWLDSLVKHLSQVQAVRERVLLTLVVSSQGQALVPPQRQGATGSGSQVPEGLGQQVQAAMRPGGAVLDPAAFVVTPRSTLMSMAVSSGAAAAFDVLDEADCPKVVRPLQSYQKLGQSSVEVAEGAPALVARRLPGVIRRDRAEKLGVGECNTRGGQGTILIDRLLHELAYKLARAPKYGA